MESFIDQLRQLTQYFEDRKERARVRLSGTEGSHWYFALIGLEPAPPDFVIVDEMVKLQSVSDPPGEVELAAAMSNAALFGAVGRYSHAINCELAVIRDPGGGDDFGFGLAWTIIAALRVRSQAEFLVPVVADHSWSTISAITNGKCAVQLMEDVPRARTFGTRAVVDASHLAWVRDNLERFYYLRRFPAFQTAVEAFTTYNHQTDYRLMAACLWAGIESLFGVSQEIGFQLAAFIATVLEPRGARRLELYRKVKRAYGLRSRAVHGGEVSKVDLEGHILEVRALLSGLLCQFTEGQHIPGREELESRLHT